MIPRSIGIRPMILEEEKVPADCVLLSVLLCFSFIVEYPVAHCFSTLEYHFRNNQAPTAINSELRIPIFSPVSRIQERRLDMCKALAKFRVTSLECPQ